MKQITKKEIDEYYDKFILPELKDPDKFQNLVLGAYGIWYAWEDDKKLKKVQNSPPLTLSEFMEKLLEQ